MPTVICFHCRSSRCACVAPLNDESEEAGGTAGASELGRAIAWLSGACLAGTALGAGLAILLGG